MSPRDVAEDTTGVLNEVSSGLNVVGVGEKVYLEALPEHGATISGAQWELTGRPTASETVLSDSTGTLVTLIPDVAGLYLVRMTPLDGSGAPGEPVEQRVYAGVWVGAGTFDTHGPPDSSIPSCANGCCHLDGTDDRLNVVGDWLDTNHASKLQLHLQGMRGAEYDVSCLPCHTVGFKDTAINNGFDDRAADISYDLEQIPALVADAANNGNDNWPLLPSELQRHASIQCESCHGPGSQHLGFILEADLGIAGVDLGTGQCAQCHDSNQHFDNRFYQWNTSSHPVTADASDGHVADSNSCRVCHTGEGFVFGVVKHEPIPQLGTFEYSGVTCSTCHDPHGSEFPHQVRLAGDTAIPAGMFADAGQGGLCVNCHHSRSANGESTALSSSRGVHNGPQADMLLGVNMAAFDLPVIGNSAHTTIVEDTCVACHMADSDIPEVGGHSYAMSAVVDGVEVINAQNACATCHPGLDDTYDRVARGDYDGDGVTAGVQEEVSGLLDLLRPQLLALPGTSLSSTGTISVSSSGFSAMTPDQKRAFFNYNFVVKDGSLGVHNTSYAVQMLQRSYAGVYGRSILDDFPAIDLRGPVQPSTIEPEPPGPAPDSPPPPVEYLAEIALVSVSPRMASEDQSGMYPEKASGLRSVGIGELVYMEAVAVDPSVGAYNWSIITRPSGSTAELSATTGENVSFRPDARGTYVVRLTPDVVGSKAGLETFDQRIYAANWAGVGIADASDAPNAPQCGTGFCHGGNNGDPRLNVLADWLRSDHSDVLAQHMNGNREAVYDLSLLMYHSVGFNQAPSAANNGFDDIAAALAYDLGQIPALVADAAANGNENYGMLPLALQQHASVQCESCHGAGSQHPPNLLQADKGIDGADLSGRQCAQCHDSTIAGAGREHQEWAATGHTAITKSTSSVTNSDTCRTCHTGEGFIATRVNNTGIVQMASSQYHDATCVVCHDPHSSDNPSQLRIDGDFEIPSGDRAFNSGTGGLCHRCHNSRIADPEATALTSSRGAHYGPQSDMIIGAGGVSFGLDFVQDFPHGVVVEDSCVACHMAQSVTLDGETEPLLMGGHTFAMSIETPSGHVENAVNACSSCHIGLDTYDRAARGDYDGDGQVLGVQTEVAGLFELLKPGILELPGMSLSSSGYISMTNPGFAALTEDQKRAIYNFNFVWKDGSRGVHNPSYAIQLLQRSYYGIYGRPINQDYQDIDLRGPVQQVAEMTATGWMVQ